MPCSLIASIFVSQPLVIKMPSFLTKFEFASIILKYMKQMRGKSNNHELNQSS